MLMILKSHMFKVYLNRFPKNIKVKFMYFESVQINKVCHNPNLGLVTKARACKVGGQEGSLGFTSHALENVGKCEGMNLHTPK